MKIAAIKIKNFRGYCNEVEIKLEDLTAIIGRNDAGKSTILEALDIFFNEGKGIIKLDKNDINKDGLNQEDNEISIGVCFEDLPTEVIVDSSYKTKLEEEYLLNSEGNLEIIKKYPNAGTAKVYIKAYHPQNENCSNLFTKRQSELRSIIKNNNIACDNQNVNSLMRKAIWGKYREDLKLSECEIDVNKEDVKRLWENLQVYLPVYSLFQSDRKNSDTDSEVQDPLKEAVKQIINDQTIQTELSKIADIVRDKIKDVSYRTLNKINEMDSEIAGSLNPIIPQSKDLKWQDVFKNVSISGDMDIPINKRGSGVRRLILLNFFRAEAERRSEDNENTNIIYAIEEPETSQHTNSQHKLIDSFKDLSKLPKTQILITTHSPNVVKRLDFNNLRLVRNDGQSKVINNVQPGSLNYPSLNEVNYLAFGEVTEEYHNELYGYIELQDWLSEFKRDKTLMGYTKLQRNGSTILQNLTLTEYIRHQIHHPENTSNTRFSPDQLEQSIVAMREFIAQKNNEQLDI